MSRRPAASSRRNGISWPPRARTARLALPERWASFLVEARAAGAAEGATDRRVPLGPQEPRGRVRQEPLAPRAIPVDQPALQEQPDLLDPLVETLARRDRQERRVETASMDSTDRLDSPALQARRATRAQPARAARQEQEPRVLRVPWDQ